MNLITPDPGWLLLIGGALVLVGGLIILITPETPGRGHYDPPGLTETIGHGAGSIAIVLGALYLIAAIWNLTFWSWNVGVYERHCEDQARRYDAEVSQPWNHWQGCFVELPNGTVIDIENIRAVGERID